MIRIQTDGARTGRSSLLIASVLLVGLATIGCQASTNAPGSSAEPTAQAATAGSSAAARESAAGACLEASVKDTWHNIGTDAADAEARSAAADALEDLELEAEEAELRDDLVAALRADPFSEDALALAAVAWEGNVGIPTC